MGEGGAGRDGARVGRSRSTLIHVVMLNLMPIELDALAEVLAHLWIRDPAARNAQNSHCFTLVSEDSQQTHICFVHYFRKV